ncbi:cytochrome b [Caldimonas sp. KR1-144]|uniref:cytochrome b n=1 Tax=Caldimonas sp. KR1-144 TaxID=3400911 RepID=UPI003C093208
MHVTALASAARPAAHPANRYSPTAIALHWLLAVMILGSMAFGWYMSDLPFSPQRLKFYNWHKWAGVTILALSIARLAWRLTHRPPAYSQRVQIGTPSWQMRAAEWTHVAMYALFFIVPLVGWAYSSAAGFPIVWFGVLPLPDFVPKDEALAKLIKPWHAVAAYTLLTLVVLHVAAALKHHFVDRDGLLARMGLGRA